MLSGGLSGKEGSRVFELCVWVGVQHTVRASQFVDTQRSVRLPYHLSKLNNGSERGIPAGHTDEDMVCRARGSNQLFRCPGDLFPIVRGDYHRASETPERRPSPWMNIHSIKQVGHPFCFFLGVGASRRTRRKNKWSGVNE
jgi:hypothetical protein